MILADKIYLQMSEAPVIKRYLHIPKRARLTTRRSQTPRPTSFLGLHAPGYITQEILESPLSPPKEISFGFLQSSSKRQ